MAKLTYDGLKPCHVYEPVKILRASELTGDAKQSLSITQLIVNALSSYYANYNNDNTDLVVDMDGTIESESSELYLNLQKAIQSSIKGITEARNSDRTTKVEVGKSSQSEPYIKLYSKYLDSTTNKTENSLYIDRNMIGLRHFNMSGDLVSSIDISNTEFSIFKNLNNVRTGIDINEDNIVLSVNDSSEESYLNMVLSNQKLVLEDKLDSEHNVTITSDSVCIQKFENEQFRTSLLGDKFYFGKFLNETPSGSNERLFLKLDYNQFSWTESGNAHNDYAPYMSFEDGQYSGSYLNIRKNSKDEPYTMVANNAQYKTTLSPNRVSVSNLSGSNSVSITSDAIQFNVNNVTSYFRYGMIDDLYSLSSRAIVYVKLKVFTTSSTGPDDPQVEVSFILPLNTDYDDVIEASNWASKISDLRTRSVGYQRIPVNGWYIQEKDKHEWQVYFLAQSNSSTTSNIFIYNTINGAGSSALVPSKSIVTELNCDSNLTGTITIYKINNAI